jgi:hypothetical protein
MLQNYSKKRAFQKKEFYKDPLDFFRIQIIQHNQYNTIFTLQTSHSQYEEFARKAKEGRL